MNKNTLIEEIKLITINEEYLPDLNGLDLNDLELLKNIILSGVIKTKIKNVFYGSKKLGLTEYFRVQSAIIGSCKRR